MSRSLCVGSENTLTVAFEVISHVRVFDGSGMRSTGLASFGPTQHVRRYADDERKGGRTGEHITPKADVFVTDRVSVHVGIWGSSA